MSLKNGQVAGLVVGMALVVGLVAGIAAMHGGKAAGNPGLMPVVTATAEMPRLVMDTVVVTAAQQVAAVAAPNVIN